MEELRKIISEHYDETKDADKAYVECVCGLRKMYEDNDIDFNQYEELKLYNWNEMNRWRIANEKKSVE